MAFLKSMKGCFQLQQLDTQGLIASHVCNHKIVSVIMLSPLFIDIQLVYED